MDIKHLSGQETGLWLCTSWLGSTPGVYQCLLQRQQVAGGEMEVKQGGSDFQREGCSVYRLSPLDVSPARVS